ncbi:hypothetical protein AB0C12_20495 [Actinoplanes sp. NPDC048967]|uniref:hypothetical protein n=1 Tax=Actinoplanes sp. NPDC048967 TaxID=3155269 RepID=UPI0033EDC858
MTTALAAIAVLISLAALTVALWQGNSNRRSAVAAEDSAVTSRESSDHARESAAHAKASAEAAARVAQAETDRDHEAYTPPLNGRFLTDSRGTGNRDLIYVFSLDRDYEIRAVLTSANGIGTTDRTVVPRRRPKNGYEVAIQAWPQGSKQSDWAWLLVRFWPPVPQEGRARPWVCRCGQTVDAGDHEGHWDWRIPVRPPQPAVRVG